MTSGYNQGVKSETTGATFTYLVLDPLTGQPSTVSTSLADWIFVYDVSSGTPVKKQQINLPSTFDGLVWSPQGERFYASGGVDDRVYVYKFDGSQYSPDAPFILLGHNSNQTLPFPSYDGGLLKGTAAAAATTGAVAAGIAVSRDGKTLLVANLENDSLSVVDTQSRQVVNEVRFFRPGDQVATGEDPLAVHVKSDSAGAARKAFVTSQRDDEVLAVDLASGSVQRIAVGAQPNRMLLSIDQSRLYVANGNSDSITEIDTETNQVVRTIPLYRSGDPYKGANPNFFALSPNGKTLYVTLGSENAVAVVNLTTGAVEGRIPTGWYPTSLSVSQDGRRLFVVNGKGNSGANPQANANYPNPTFKSGYVFALEKGGLATIPVPRPRELARLTRLVDQNNGFHNRKPDPVMAYLRTKIKHVIYIIKENRTYDSMLGDLPVGNGDPSLVLFPEPVSPNHHRLALDFVTLDNFYDSGETSGVGWNWSTYARTTDYAERTQWLVYGNAGSASPGVPNDSQSTNRNLNLALPQTAADPSPLSVRRTGLLDPTGLSSILPGTKDVNAPAGDNDLEPDAIGGYLWDAALRAGKTVRNYGAYTDFRSYYGTSQSDPTQPDPTNAYYIPISANPYAANLPQSAAGKPALLSRTDPYYRGYDMKNADIYLFNEWKREFDGFVTGNNLPNLTLIRLPHDHLGSFSQAVAGLNSAPLQVADNDYALGRIVESVSKSNYWRDTAIVVVEDDAQDGPDHVDSHRSPAYILSPYTRRGAVVSTNYNTVNLIRTMEDLLGIGYLGTFDANARPMSDVFALQPDFTTYTAIVPGNLCAPPVDPTLVPACQNPSSPRTTALSQRRDSAWWAQATRQFDFSVEDKVDPVAFNQVLWTGLMGDLPYPVRRHRRDLRSGRSGDRPPAMSYPTAPSRASRNGPD